ncbi:hypothetical protein QBC47DRAFT_392538 [Echria macrotheca]|uniref:Spray n=1 Tax=Echria macrotheca TaxID=438768 RepID=A0AAJ0B5M2_9PEZI|nr:hypothetical protein QBC47DRAFT_392538 [Echria macrotheca]
MEPFRAQRPALHASGSSGSLSRISTISDFTDLDIPLHARPSLVSLQSDRSTPPPPSSTAPSQVHTGWSAYTGYANGTGTGGGGYEAVPLVRPGLGILPPARQPSRSAARTTSLRKPHHEPIREEEDDGIDLGLIRAAAPLGGHETEHNAPEEAFDISSALGPLTKADEAFLRKLQEHEAKGKLTGGLGAGMRTQATLSESALLATSPVAETRTLPLARSFSRALPRGNLNRGATVRQLGQHEANKRGEVIEVVMDGSDEHLPPTAESEVDLSVMAGLDAGVGLGINKSSTFATVKSQRTQIFYPQPNWKPFSMRWPYLLSLILVSIGLAVAQEILYRKSTEEPLITFHKPSDIPGGEYFAFKFLPMLIAVSYGVLWQVTDFEVKRLEAFYQLSKEGGALAAESINVDYITYFSFFRPYRAFRCKHYAVAISSVASLLANAATPTLAAASLVLSPDRPTRLQFPDAEKQILIHPVWSRLQTVNLAVIAALGCVLFYQLQTRRSGLLADVRGIAGLAAMATVSHILMDFKDMDVATHEDIHHKLKDHRYVLRNSSLAPDDLLNPPSKQERDRYTTNHLSENPQPLMLRAAGIVPYIIGVLFFAILIPLVLFTPATALTDKAAWVVTALAVCVKLGWGGLETDVRMMEPFYILSRRHACPKTLTLDYTAMPFGWVVVKGLVNRHWLVFAVGFGTVLAELLTVLVTSLATVEGRVFLDLINNPDDTAASVSDDPTDRNINAGQETPGSFWVSLTLAMLILVYMGSVAAVVLLTRGRRVFLPRQPNTIASVLAYIHQSKMLYDFVGTAKLSNAQMVRRLEDIGKTYGLGWFQGRDGQSHCGVDEEELLSGYKFGYDYSRATKPWEEEQVNWL